MADKPANAQPQQKPAQPIGTAKTGLNVTNTIEPQCDKHDPNVARWFDTGTDHQGVAMPPVRKGNDVQYLIDGQAAFQSMFDAMKTATGAGHFIYLLCWYLDLDCRMSTSDDDVADRTAIHVPDGDDVVQQVGEDNYNPRQLFTKVASSGPVEVRALCWDQVGKANTKEVEWINKNLDTGAAILDNRTLHFGAHHQKAMVVYGSQGLIAFCGGIDINTNRISQESDSNGSPLHDVHCRITGPAARDLLLLFVQRWTDHPDVKSLPAGKQDLIGLYLSAVPDTSTSGGARDKYVQIGRTFGNGENNRGVTGELIWFHGYSFAPKGEMTAWQMILHGIKTAKEFIYVEDQYLISMDASNALRDQLSVVKKIIILIPHSSQLAKHDGDYLPGVWGRRKDFIDNIVSKGNADRLIVCALFPEGVARATPVVDVPDDAYHTYVHAKTWVFDDEFAIIGSANCNNRGYSHDSEVVAGITDESADAPCTLHFAHRYRMQLWAEHLNMRAADLFDPIAASVHWAAPAITSRFAIYDRNAVPDGHYADGVIDPTGY